MKIIMAMFFLTFSFGNMLANIHIEPEILYKGKPVKVTVDEPVDSIKITYRPNSQVAKTEYLTANGLTNEFEWIPSRAGVVAMDAKGDSKTVSVRFATTSWSGVFIMVLAGLLLFGGATFAFRLLMYGKAPGVLDSDIEHRVDT